MLSAQPSYNTCPAGSPHDSAFRLPTRPPDPTFFRLFNFPSLSRASPAERREAHCSRLPRPGVGPRLPCPPLPRHLGAPPRRGGEGRGGVRGRACQVRRGRPGPLTSAQVREGRRRGRPLASFGVPPAPLPDQVRRGWGAGARWAAGTLPLEPAGAALLASGAAASAPARAPPALREEWALRTEGAAGRPVGPAEGAGRRPSASGLVTPPWDPPPGCRARRRPRSHPAPAGPTGPPISA